jgi:hypothetical protein
LALFPIGPAAVVCPSCQTLGRTAWLSKSRERSQRRAEALAASISRRRVLVSYWSRTRTCDLPGRSIRWSRQQCGGEPHSRGFVPFNGLHSTLRLCYRPMPNPRSSGRPQSSFACLRPPLTSTLGRTLAGFARARFGVTFAGWKQVLGQRGPFRLCP